MEIYLQNTVAGLVPLYDADYDEKKKLKIGQTYKAEIKLARNIQFHRKYFALINCAWEYLDEKQSAGFRNVENFRKYLEVAAGSCDVFYSPKYKDWCEIPKSISFEKMKAEEFNKLYEDVKDVLFKVFLKNISVEEFESNLKFF